MKRLPRPLSFSLLAVLLASAIGGALAQTYRSVTPDGKVIYSDRKPTDPKLNTSELGKTVYAPLLGPSRGPFDLRPAATPPAPRAPLAYGLKPAVDVGGQPFAPGLPEAILDVVVHQLFVQSLVETCSRVQPEFGERYKGGVYNWRQRNADILDRSNRIAFTRFTGEQRDTLRNAGRAYLASLIPPADAGSDYWQSWCAKASTDLARRQFELVGDARVAPILNFALH